MASAHNLPMDQRENQNPPPYTQTAQGQKYVQDFVQQNPQGFIHTQQPGSYAGQPTQPQAGFSNISGGYGYNQPPVQQTSSSNTVVVLSWFFTAVGLAHTTIAATLSCYSLLIKVCQNQTSPTLILNPAPYSYLVPAILSCFFCCWLVGIGAIIAAVISRGQSDDLNFDEARKSANIAKILTIISFVLGFAFYVGFFIIYSVALNQA